VRSRVVIVAGLAAVLAAVAAGSAPAGSSSPDARSAPLRVFYLYHAKFTVAYDVDWMTKQGSESQECSTWRVDRGSTKVVVRDAPWTQKTKRRKVRRTDGIPGSMKIPGPSLRKGVKAIWAGGSAVGRAEATVNRTWIQRGGVNWSAGCGGSPPDPFRPSPDDCGARTVTSRTATFLPETRKRFDTLRDVMYSEGSRAALAFSMPAPAPYRRCKTHEAAPDLPANFGFWVGKTDIHELSRIESGGTAQVHYETSGDCAYDIDPEDSCTFRLELTLDVHSWEPGTPYP
jgi:hypothetical protein